MVGSTVWLSEMQIPALPGVSASSPERSLPCSHPTGLAPAAQPTAFSSGGPGFDLLLATTAVVR